MIVIRAEEIPAECQTRVAITDPPLCWKLGPTPLHRLEFPAICWILGLGFEANRAAEHMKTSRGALSNWCVLPRDHRLASRTDAERTVHRLLDQIGFKSIPLRFFHSIWTRSFCPTLKLYARIHDIFNGNHNGNGIYCWKLENPLLPLSLPSFRSRLLLLLFFEFFSQI